VQGRIDHLDIDLARGRLFVAELGNGSVGVLDLARGTLLHRIGGLTEPQGVACAGSTDILFVASGGDGTLRRYAGGDFTPMGVTRLGDDADNVRLDPRHGQVLVGYGHGALATVDPASGVQTGTITLNSHPEPFRLGAHGLVCVNVPDAREVAVVDRTSGKQVATWPVRGQENFPMAVDEEAGRVLIVARNPPELLVFAAGSGETLARLPVCGDADDVFWDAKRQRIYVSCGEGLRGRRPAGRRCLGRPDPHPDSSGCANVLVRARAGPSVCRDACRRAASSGDPGLSTGAIVGCRD
jgi:hypothetical protein